MQSFLQKKSVLVSKPFSKKNGFTLLELLLSVALISLLAGIAAPMYLSLQSENEVAIAATTVADILRRGQIHAQAVDGDSDWGVEMVSSTITVFKGNNFASRDQNLDENYKLSATVKLSGLNEVIFNKFSGWTAASGTVMIIHQDGRQKNVSINELGIVGL
ncbi:MAG: prepilin-type N-terminal cleavage/methylation domain-containing protein [Candidatus Magasanikbacteria bacterium]|nr:prepilin-type N-terminal cleavage/methylation domain-containing protein [Candidatus Magasanikbacteria bacterium]